MSATQRWILVVVFAAAMAWFESAAVTYLRTLVDRVEPYQANPLPIAPRLGEAELIREMATLIMLVTVGWLAGNTRRTRFGYVMIAFGVWDILYYVFLKIIVDWPHSILDWDVLFLLPLPWWGPVIAPVLVAGLMIIGGTLVTQFSHPDYPIWPGRGTWILGLIGAALALFVFMSDAIRSTGGGIEAIRTALPTWFNWPLFIIALALMATSIIDMVKQIWQRHKSQEGITLVPGSMHFGAQSLLLLLLYKIISRDT